MPSCSSSFIDVNRSSHPKVISPALVLPETRAISPEICPKKPALAGFHWLYQLMGNYKIPDNITVNFRWHSRLWFQARYGFHRATWPKFFHDKLTSSNYKPPEKRQVHRSEMPLTIIGQLFVYTSPSSNFFSQQMLQLLLAYSQATSLDLSEANRSQRPV